MKEVENVTKDGMDIINRVKEIVEKMGGKIDELNAEIERIDVDYADRSEQFKEEKRKELMEKLGAWKQEFERKQKELTDKAQKWLDDKTKDLTEKYSKRLIKIKTEGLKIFG